MILSKNELRSSSGRIRYRVRVRAGIEYGITAVSIMSCSCPTTVPLPCPTYVVVVPFVFLLSVASACSTIHFPLSHYSAVRLSAVRCSRSCSLSAVLSVLCACSSCVVLTFFSCARVRCALFPRCSHALIRHGCFMQRYIGSCS
jgi:hypothetical protein